MSERPDLSKRRTIVPAPDEGIDPIDPHKPVVAPTSTSTPSPVRTREAPAASQSRTVRSINSGTRTPAPAKETVSIPKDLNLQVTDEVMETIDFAKFKTKLTKREIVQRAVLEYWSDYRPKKDN